MEKDEKRIEDLLNKLMTADSLEKAPLDFTKNVMTRVEDLSKSSVTTYKPLIPKYVFWLIGAGFVALVINLILKKSSNYVSFAERHDLPKLSLDFLEGLSFNFSSTLMYATVLFAIMISIQVPLLKQYFNNRLSY